MRAALLAVLGLPGAAYVYQGQELGLPEVDVPENARQDPAWVARRLCPAPQRVAEVAGALDALSRPRTAVTLTWRP